MMKSCVFAIVTVLGVAAPASAQQPVRLMNANCTAGTEQVTEPKTGRTYLLDYPCDLKPNERVTFILNLHGGGSSGTWQRRYFPAFDYKEKHRLVVASPYSPTRSWSENDDQYLQNIVTALIEQIGRQNIQSFWLAGHSQGGATSRRIVCTEFFASKVDGFLSLSGGRLGGAAPRSPNAGRPAQQGEAAAGRAGGATTSAGGPPAAGGRGTAAAAPPADPACDFSHIFAIGQYEITELPATSTLARKYNCGARVRGADIVDDKAGYVHDGGRQNPASKEWGRLPRPGTAQVFNYPNCTGGRIVADVMRMDKGHTEGLEPRVTEELVRMMTSLRTSKLRP